MRPRSPPCLPTCELVPQMTSSTSAVSRSLRSASALSTVAAEVLRVDVGERALADLADAARRAAGVDDEGVGHGVSRYVIERFGAGAPTCSRRNPCTLDPASA